MQIFSLFQVFSFFKKNVLSDKRSIIKPPFSALPLVFQASWDLGLVDLDRRTRNDECVK